MITKDTDVMGIFSRQPRERRGISTPEEPLPKIPVNPDFEFDPVESERLCISGAGDPYAPFPYRPMILENRVDIFSGDGRVVATLLIENYPTHHEMVYTAMLLCKAPVFCNVARKTLIDLGRFHNGIKKRQIDVNVYTRQSRLFHEAYEEIFSQPSGLPRLYEPVYADDTEDFEYDDCVVVPVIAEEDLPEISDQAYETWFA